MRKIVWLFAALLLHSVMVIAQVPEITGQILDDKGQPVPYATITETGTPRAVTADGEGKFRFTPGRAGARLTISATGFQPQTTTPSGNTLSITLATGSSQMEEVVVTALGIKRSEKALGYSVTTVDPNDIVQKSEPDPLKGLAGKVAGVDIRVSQGAPGAATRINIRGNTSFYGKNEPLIVVDGIPFNNDQVATSSQTSGGGAYSNGFASIDPNDIASISILKGAAASALYGSRASNGAVIVTTKSGSAAAGKRKAEVTFSSSASIENIANLPDYQNKYGAGSQFIYSPANGSWGPAFGTLDSIDVWPDYAAAFPDLFPSGKVAYQAYPNNVKDLFQTGTVLENSISVNGGNAQSGISATASYLAHDGYIPNSYFNRANMSVGGTTKLENGLNINANFSYTQSNQNGSAYGENQIDGAASSFARTLFLARNWDLNLPFEDAVGRPVSTSNAQYDNPRWSLKRNTVNTLTDRYIAGLKFNYDIFPWFNLGYQIGINNNAFNRKEITDIGSRAASSLGRIIIHNYQFAEIESNLLANFNQKISERIGFRGLLGYNINQRTTRSDLVIGNEIIAPGIYNITNTKSQLAGTVVGVPNYQRRRLSGVFGSAEFDYQNFLFVTLTGRYDKSSTLPVDNSSYFYPSASASFVFTEALDLNRDILSYGKLRTSWAKVGNDTDPYNLGNVYQVNNPFLGQSGATINPAAGNPLLKPEFTEDFEVGTTLEFLNGRIGLDVAVYSRSSTNQLANVTLPPSSGFTEVIDNFGKLTNNGYEIDLSLTPVKTKDFTWNLHGIFTRNRSVVRALLEGVERIPLDNILADISPYLEPGKPFGYLRGTVNYRDGEGNLLIDPATGLLIRATEQDMIGDPNPDFKTGLTTSFSYKGFFLNALFDWTQGGDIYSVTVSTLMGRGITKDTEDREKLHVIPGYYGDANTGLPLLDDKGDKIPNQTQVSLNELYFGESFAINAASEWNVYDATLYTFRELTLGYNFPKKMFEKSFIGGLSITFTGRNLWYLAPNVPKYTRFNPETNSFGSTTTQGIELSAAPTSRRFGVNLRATF